MHLIYKMFVKHLKLEVWRLEDLGLPLPLLHKEIFIPAINWKAFDSLKKGEKGLARLCARLPFVVGYCVCLGPLGDAFVVKSTHIWPRYRRQKFQNNFDIKEGKWRNECKTTKFALSFIYYFKYLLEYFFVISMNFSWLILWPKVVEFFSRFS